MRPAYDKKKICVTKMNSRPLAICHFLCMFFLNESCISYRVIKITTYRDQPFLLVTLLHAQSCLSGKQSDSWYDTVYKFILWLVIFHVKTKLSLGTSSKAWWCHVYVVFSLSTGVGPVVPADLHCPLPASAAPPAFHQLSIPQLPYILATCRVIISGIAFHYTQMFLGSLCYL